MVTYLITELITGVAGGVSTVDVLVLQHGSIVTTIATNVYATQKGYIWTVPEDVFYVGTRMTIAIRANSLLSSDDIVQSESSPLLMTRMYTNSSL
jgi:hypothetical protein